ncbi:MAG: S8 family serine peptidase [Pyrinomonadaceae bacterium]
MNRNNFWIHFGIAVILITMAAVLGQIRRWENSLRLDKLSPGPIAKSEPKAVIVNRKYRDSEAEVLVRFKPGVNLAEIRRLVARNNDRIEDEIESVSGLVAVDDLDNADARAIALQYSSMTDLVAYAEPNFQIRLGEPPVSLSPRNLLHRESEGLGVPNDPQFSDQWALNNDGKNGGKDRADIDALKAWLKTQGSKDVVVAVLDSGVDYTHEDLVSNMWLRPENLPQYTDDELGTFNDVRGFDADANAPDPMDDNGHGTHCAGIVGAEGNNEKGVAGINWNVKIMPLKFLGRGGFGSTKNAIEAINYAIDRKQKGVNVRVISASWGSTQYSRALEDAIRAAGEQGILFVAAAGNSSTDNDRRAHYPSNYKLPNVISVAALDRTDSLASFSNYGAKSVHIAAPGREILSTWLNDEYREASGTSMATPYVSGVAALVLASEPKLTVDQLRGRLLKSVDALDSLSGKIVAGGRLNASKALGD